VTGGPLQLAIALAALVIGCKSTQYAQESVEVTGDLTVSQRLRVAEEYVTPETESRLRDALHGQFPTVPASHFPGLFLKGCVTESDDGERSVWIVVGLQSPDDDVDLQSLATACRFIVEREIRLLVAQEEQPDAQAAREDPNDTQAEEGGRRTKP
jgi:hypothetical protein